MSIDPTTGTIVLGQNEFAIHRDMSLSDFISSQVGTTAILDVLNQPYATYSFLIKTGLTTIGVSLVFESQRLDSVRLERITPEASWANWCQENELKNKTENDELLVSFLGKPPHIFSWGEAVSSFDPRSGSAHITIRYLKNNETCS